MESITDLSGEFQIQNSISKQQFQNQTSSNLQFFLESVKFNSNYHSFVRLLNLPKRYSLDSMNVPLLFKSPNQYIFTKDFGLLRKKQKWINANQIIIGRQEGSDIKLNDVYVSNEHCVIYLQKGWANKNKMKQQFMSFTTNSSLRKLNYDILDIIWKFAMPKRQFYVQDLGSSEGTSLQIKDIEPIREGMIFKIPHNVNIEVIQISLIKKSQIQAFIQKCCQLQKIVPAMPIIEQEQSQSQYFISILNLLVQNKSYIFFGTPRLNIKYIIGRHESNHIYINESQTSRRQCTIEYDRCNKQWMIYDGHEGRPSVNGTWKDIRTVQQKKYKKQSAVVVIRNGDRIMLGDTFLEFQTFNC